MPGCRQGLPIKMVSYYNVFLNKGLSDQHKDARRLERDFEHDEERPAKSVIRKPRSTESQKTSEDPLPKVLSVAGELGQMSSLIFSFNDVCSLSLSTLFNYHRINLL